MNGNCDELQQLTALEALGALDGADLARLRDRLESDPAAREELRRFLDVAAAMASTAPLRRPSRAVRSRVMERIAKQGQAGRGGASSDAGVSPSSSPSRAREIGEPLREGFQFVGRDLAWMDAPLPGMRFKVLSAGPSQDYAMLEVELSAGAHYPEHEHLGAEDLYLLTGDLRTEGVLLGPGDLFHAEPGTNHEGLWTSGGCTALLIVSKAAFEAMRPA